MTTKTTKTTTTMRRCVGSERFGIEPHEAPIDAFSKQPSQNDGLSRRYTPHWREYVRGLRKDAMARKAAEAPSVDEASSEPAAADPKPEKRAAKPTRRRTTNPSPRSEEVAQAEALVAEVDALPGPEHAKRVGDADVQAALELAGTTRMLAD